MGPVTPPTMFGAIGSVGTDTKRGCGTLTARVRAVAADPLSVAPTPGKPSLFEDILGNVLG